jgi:hypothetical protein
MELPETVPRKALGGSGVPAVIGQPARLVQKWTGLGLVDELGSSIRASASLCPLGLRSRLVICVFRVSVKLPVGTTWPAGVGGTPVQVSKISPTCSVIPSGRMIGGPATLAVQVMVTGLSAHPGTVIKPKKTKEIQRRIHLPPKRIA